MLSLALLAAAVYGIGAAFVGVLSFIMMVNGLSPWRAALWTFGWPIVIPAGLLIDWYRNR